jgi:hypothetical protein
VLKLKSGFWYSSLLWPGLYSPDLPKCYFLKIHTNICSKVPIFYFNRPKRPPLITVTSLVYLGRNRLWLWRRLIVFTRKICLKFNARSMSRFRTDAIFIILLKIMLHLHDWWHLLKGQIKSEWIYEVIEFPNCQLKKLKDFCPNCLFEALSKISTNNFEYTWQT